MIYTYGHTKSYLEYFQKYIDVKKMGRRIVDGELYSGGVVFETELDARRHCPKEYSVFGVEAKWGIETYYCKDKDYHVGSHALLITSPLVRLY